MSLLIGLQEFIYVVYVADCGRRYTSIGVDVVITVLAGWIVAMVEINTKEILDLYSRVQEYLLHDFFFFLF